MTAQLADLKKTLTYDEYRQKLLEKYEANPNDPDPEVQKLKKELEEFNARFAPTQREIKIFTENARLAIESLKPLIPLLVSTTESLKPTLASFDYTAKDILPVLASIEAFIPPLYLIKTMERVAEDFRGMSEPLRAIGEVIAIYQTPLLYFKLPELHNNVIVGGYEPVEVEIEPAKSLEAELLEENNHLLREMARLQKAQLSSHDEFYGYDPSSKTFVVKMKQWGAIPFKSKRGNLSMAYFFEICLDLLEKRGQTIGDFKEVYVSMGELIDGLATKGIKGLTKRSIAFMRKNIVDDKIEPQGLTSYVSISTYSKKNNGYCFRIRIKVPTNSFS